LSSGSRRANLWMSGHLSTTTTKQQVSQKSRTRSFQRFAIRFDRSSERGCIDTSECFAPITRPDFSDPAVIGFSQRRDICNVTHARCRARLAPAVQLRTRVGPLPLASWSAHPGLKAGSARVTAAELVGEGAAYISNNRRPEDQDAACSASVLLQVCDYRVARLTKR
jgi:hypothetical protein